MSQASLCAPRGRGKSKRSLELVDAAREILREIQPASVRGVAYKLFTRGLIPNMSKLQNDRVSKQLTWAREAGLIPWEWLVDETRDPERPNVWADPEAYVEAVRRSYRRDRWTDQPRRAPEVWSEKGTIRGVLAPVLHDYGIVFRCLHGYGSATSIYDVAQETRGYEEPLQVLYTGDWDCSGLHMSEVDLPRRLEEYGGHVRVRRLALTADHLPGLPSFEAETKIKDPRHGWFVANYGERCWELDALSPVLLRQAVKDAVVTLIEPAAWQRAALAEAAERDSLRDVLNRWPGLSKSRRAENYSEGGAV